MINQYKELMDVLGVNRIKTNENLSSYSTFRLGGPADLFFKAVSKEDMLTSIGLAEKLKIRYFVLGQGTNVIFSDLGFRGLVIKNESSVIRFKGLTGSRLEKNPGNSFVDKVYLEVDSGVSVNRLVRNTISQGLAGLEYFLGQPGTVGGAVWINAHNIKNEKYFGDLLLSGRIYRPYKGEFEVPNSYFRFNYDFSKIQKTGEIVLSVTLLLSRKDKNQLWSTAKKALEYRQNTQPSGTSSAGCLFRNISKSQAFRLSTPDYTCSAGYLLDAAGLKGKSIGSLQFSASHANFLVNKGKATFTDMLELIALARKKVYEKFGIQLELEAVLVNPE